MSADRRLTIGASLLAGLIAGSAAAQETDPDIEFLEYLGTWQATDEDWIVISEMSPDLPNDVSESEAPPIAADGEDTESRNES